MKVVYFGAGRLYAPGIDSGTLSCSGNQILKAARGSGEQWERRKLSRLGGIGAIYEMSACQCHCVQAIVDL